MGIKRLRAAQRARLIMRLLRPYVEALEASWAEGKKYAARCRITPRDEIGGRHARTTPPKKPQ